MKDQEEQPFYVNAKQYHRILKRRIARAKLEEALSSAPGRKPYLHESRHKHAMRRPRGQGGRFLTAAEIAELEKQKKASESENSANQSPATSFGSPANTESLTVNGADINAVEQSTNSSSIPENSVTEGSNNPNGIPSGVEGNGL